MRPRAPARFGGRIRFGDSNVVRWIAALAIASLIYSYQLTTPILLRIGANTSEINLQIKALLVAAFGIVAVSGLAVGKALPRRSLALIAYLALLGFRLLYDVLALGILPLFQTEFYVLAYYFGLTCLPILAILLTLSPRDTRIVHDALFWMLAAANIVLLIYIGTGGVVTSATVFAGRFEVGGSVSETAVLNPIGVAAAGAGLAAIAIGRLTALRSLNAFGQIFALAMTVLGVTNMFAGGSRGPALALALVVLITVYTLIRGLPGNGLIKPRLAMWIYGGVVAAGFAAVIISQAMSIQVFDRFAMMFDARMAGGREERDYALQNALADFVDAPFIGSSYLTTIGRQYPHNIVVDALMATGIVGFSLFAVAMFWMLRGLLRMIHGHAGPHGFGIALVAVCIFTLGMTSGAAWQSPDFWVMFTVVLILGNFRLAPLHRGVGPARPAPAPAYSPYKARQTIR